MNAIHLLFGPVGPALKFIFSIGYIPNENDFLELTDEQYAAYLKQYGEVTSKMYMFAPNDPHHALNEDYNEISCIDEYELQGFKEAAALIQKYCDKSGRIFQNTKEKLQYMASALPDVFSKGTPYEKYHHLSISITNSKN